MFGQPIVWGMKMRVIKYIIALLIVVLIPLSAYGDRSGYSMIARGNAYSDVTAPIFSSAAIAANGETVTITLSEPVTGTENDTFNLDCDGASGADVVLTYASGSGSPNLVFTSAATVQSTETCNLDFNGDANDFEDAAGNDLADFTDAAVTNNSEVASACVTTNVAFWWRAEALDFSAGNGTTDYSAGDDVATAVGDAAINADAKKIGTNGLDIPSGYDYAWFTVSADDILASSESRVGFWFRYTTWVDGSTIFAANDNSPLTRIQLQMVDSNELRFYWYDNLGARTNLDSSGLDLASATWYFIEMAWKTATDYREIFVNGNSVESSSQTIADAGVSLNVMYFGNITGNAPDFHMDNMMTSSDSTDALYPCRDEAEWP